MTLSDQTSPQPTSDPTEQGSSLALEPGHVVVVAGGLSHERDVSLRSGRRLAEALRTQGAEVTEIDATSTFVSRLREAGDAVVISALHGASGEDGSVASVLEVLGLPFVGSSASACRTAWDKVLAKQVVAADAAFRAAGGTLAPHVVLTQAAVRDLGARDLLSDVVSQLGLPLVVKPVHGGSSLGVSVVHAASDVTTALVTAFAYDDEVMLEAYATGTEVAVSVVATAARAEGLRVLPAVEIVPDGGVYDYTARYTAGQTEFFVPARLEAETTRRVAAVAVAVHNALGLRDVSRADLVVSETGEVAFLEANVSPGLTETSLLPLAAAGAGEELGALYASLIAEARDRQLAR